MTDTKVSVTNSRVSRSADSGRFDVIYLDEAPRLLLASCPSVARSQNSPALGHLHDDLEALCPLVARHLVSMMNTFHRDLFAAFSLIERCLSHGEQEVGQIISRIFLPALRDFAIEAGIPMNSVFRSMFGPATALAWDCCLNFSEGSIDLTSRLNQQLDWILLTLWSQVPVEDRDPSQFRWEEWLAN